MKSLILSGLSLFISSSYAADKVVCAVTLSPRDSVYGISKSTEANGAAVNEALADLFEKLPKEKPSDGRGKLPVQKTMEDCKRDAATFSALKVLCDWFATLPMGNRQAALNTIQCTSGRQRFLSVAPKVPTQEASAGDASGIREN